MVTRMKINKHIAIFLATSVFLSGCSTVVNETEIEQSSGDSIVVTESSVSDVSEPLIEAVETVVDVPDEVYIASDYVDLNSFTGLNDENLLTYVEDMVYLNAIDSIDSADYYVENVEAVYISDEYLETLAANSQVNIFFGHTEEELINQFEGTRYIFTLGPDGDTVVEEFVSNDELYGAYRQALTNVAIGTGVILVCVTVAVVAPAVGAPAAISMVFSYAATSAAEMAVGSALVAGTIGGIVEGVQTHDFNSALQAAAVSGSEGFMWGAISGAVLGGASELSWLSGTARETGLSINEIAQIQQRSRLPLSALRQLNSTQEFEVLNNAGLRPAELSIRGNTQSALIREIEWDYVNPDLITNPNQLSNYELVLNGNAPFVPGTTARYELHHVGQSGDLLAILTPDEHDLIPTFSGSDVHVGANENVWRQIRQSFWQEMGNLHGQGLL